MSKRFYPQQHGDRKKAKLDISISDHNFPLSQNNELKDDNWGDDNDDEILLLASQACEQAYSNNDFSQLPDYSICMQPDSTSTQLQPQPSTSKAEFMFKKPSFNPPSSISTQLREKCDRISSPLPGISSKVVTKLNGLTNITDDLIINNKFKNQDSDYIYKQLLQLQEENAKLKSENGKLLEKCVTKEGEASILRTQLKSSQIAVDNARLEKIKAQERVQVEWNDKLVTANNLMHDLRTQLDFKNLEIISIKEKCKKLESNKIKLTQVTVGANDISVSHRNNSTQNETIHRRVKTSSCAVQTSNQLRFLKLNKICVVEQSKLASILSLILEPTTTQQHSILDYNEKLQKSTEFLQNKCRIYSTFHRVPSTPVAKERARKKIVLSSIYEDVVSMVGDGLEGSEQRFLHIFDSIKQVLNDTRSKLEELSQRVTSSFQKEMDEKYMEASLEYLDVGKEDLLKGRALYKEEHDILARRMVVILAYILESSKGIHWYSKIDKYSSNLNEEHLVILISNICRLLNNTSCATLYSGFLLSTTYLLKTLLHNIDRIKLIEILKSILLSRPMTFVVSRILVIITNICGENSFNSLCPGNNSGNLKTDYDQGVLLYKKDSCYIQILLKQVETCMKCVEKQKLAAQAIETTRQLIILYHNVGDSSRLAREKSRCDCQLMLVQLIVYALRVCAVMLDICSISTENTQRNELLSVCRCGIHLLYQCAVRDVEFSSQLSHNEGHLIEFCEIMRVEQHSEVYNNMLSELASTLQSSPEETLPSYHRQPWLKSFESFSLVD